MPHIWWVFQSNYVTIIGFHTIMESHHRIIFHITLCAFMVRWIKAIHRSCLYIFFAKNCFWSAVIFYSGPIIYFGNSLCGYSCLVNCPPLHAQGTNSFSHFLSQSVWNVVNFRYKFKYPQRQSVFGLEQSVWNWHSVNLKLNFSSAIYLLYRKIIMHPRTPLLCKPVFMENRWRINILWRSFVSLWIQCNLFAWSGVHTY